MISELVTVIVLTTTSPDANGGIEQYNQVLQMVVQGRAEMEGSPFDFVWRCKDEEQPCVVRVKK